MGAIELIQRPGKILLPGAMPVAAGEEMYAADRDKVFQWRNQSQNRQQWRRDSARAIEYWDGNQFDADTAAKFKERGLPMITHNVIKRWINSVIGTLERNLTDGVVKVEDNKLESLEKALSQKLKEAERMTNADRACLDAMDAAIKGGMGWVEVATNDDPFQYPDRVDCVPWREMYWDMSAKKPDLDDAEWFRRIKYYKRALLMAAFPDAASLILLAGTGDDGVSWNQCERLERDEHYWRDPTRWTGDNADDTMAIMELRYRVYVRGYVIQTAGGPVIFDERNENHLAAYYRGLVQPVPATYRRVRQAYWLGPHCLVDRWNPSPGNEVGWVPFNCYVEDQTGAPYGLIRDMISLQDEINSTKAKAHWSMDSSTIIADHDRVMDIDDAREAINRRDGIIILNGLKREGKFEIDRHPGITADNVSMYKDAVSMIGYVHGLDAPIAGSTSSAGQSGISQQIQIDQSVTCMGKPMANYRGARKRVLGLLLDQQIERMSDVPAELPYKDANGEKKTVQINVPVQLEDGTVEELTLQSIKRQVVLDEVPSTPTYRSQQYQKILETLQTLPEQFQGMLIPAMFEMSDLPEREKYADMARKELGLAGPQNEAEAQQQAKEAQLKERAINADVALKEANQQLTQAKAAVESAKVQNTDAGTQKILAEIQKLIAEVASIKQDQADQAKLMAEGGPVKSEAMYRF